MYARALSLPRILPIASLTLALAISPALSRAQQDPPPGDSRLAHIEGIVNISPAGYDSWGQAENNLPINPGDRVFADSDSQAEIQTGPVRAYFASRTDLILTRFDPQGIEFGVAGGSADFHSDGLPPGQSFYVSTPNGGIALSGRGGFRVDAMPNQQTTIITNGTNWNPNPIQINGAGGFSTMLMPGQSIQLTGTNPVYAQPLVPTPMDAFQHWAEYIEYKHQSALSLRYVNPGLIGYGELDEAGDWQPESPYGPIWFPHVEAGWAPYRHGHWINRPFFGWVWVADEPWGAAPFHYGRWVVLDGRWGWIPGPRESRPVWSPAQVVFAGGISVGGASLSVWFPLGPGEPYKPWYPCSPHYIDQVNISNIHPAPQVVVHNTYVNIVNVTNVTNITYVNRTVGVTAMRPADFAAGHPAASVAVKIDVNLVQHVQPAAPAVQPPAQPILTHPVARPAAVQAARPVLINHQGQQVAATANARPAPVPVKAAPPAPQPLPGRQAAGTGTLGGKPVQPAPAAGKPNQPSQPAKAGAPAQPESKQTPASSAKPQTPAKPEAAPAAKPQPAAPAKAQPAPAAKPETTPATKPATPADKANNPQAATQKPGKPNSKDQKKNQKEEEKKTHPDKPE